MSNRTKVTDEMVERARNAYYKERGEIFFGNPEIEQDAMRAALEAALGEKI